MKRALTIGTVVFVILISACMLNEGNMSGSDNQENTSNNNGEERIIPVKVEKIHRQDILQELAYPANLVAFEEVHYAPASPGRIKNIKVEVGDRVKKGQLLVQMDRTQLQQALTQLDNARSTYQRIDTLYKAGSISEQQYDQAKTQYEIAKTNLQFQKENTTLTSPLTGIVTGRYFEPGELYSGAPNTQAGKAAVLSLQQINPMKAKVGVAQRYFPVVKKGMRAIITTDIYPKETFVGKIYRIHPTIDPATRSFQVEFSIHNPKELLRPGMFAGIKIKLGETEAFVVPAIAILKQEGTNNRYVFINKNNTAKKVDVTLGKRFDDKIEIKTNDLQEGDELIIAGQGGLMDGSKINIIK